MVRGIIIRIMMLGNVAGCLGHPGLPSHHLISDITSSSTADSYPTISDADIVGCESAVLDNVITDSR